LAEFAPGGRYEHTVAIYRDNSSAEKIGMFDKDLINRLPASVKWIAHNGAGYEAVDVEACRLRGNVTLFLFNPQFPLAENCYKGIYVSNTPVVVDDATATTALYLLISTFRQFSLAERSLRKSDWKPSAISSGCRDLAGQTLAILGLGGIGTRLAVLAHTFSMRIVYHSRHEHPAAPGYCKYFENLEAMLPEADVLSLHIPLRPGTVNLIDRRLIRMLKPGAIIINTARGRVMDEEALIEALEDGHVYFLL
jgi:glyoxylate reductase